MPRKLDPIDSALIWQQLSSLLRCRLCRCSNTPFVCLFRSPIRRLAFDQLTLDLVLPR